MRTRERLARMARIDDARFVARFAWPGVLGIILSLAWIGIPHDSVVAVPGLLVLLFLHPLAILCVVLALFRRGRARRLVLLSNGAFLLISVLVLVLSRGIP